LLPSLELQILFQCPLKWKFSESWYSLCSGYVLCDCLCKALIQTLKKRSWKNTVLYF